jgi:hypothetical protein
MSGYVYLIGNSIFGWYKIGKSITPEIRIKDLGILLPFKIKVYSVWAAKNHHLMESSLHEIYEHNRINGEWFEFTGEEIGKLIDSIPVETRIFLDNTDKFSNIDVDRKSSKRVLGVRKEKLRGNFTPEEREHRRIESIEKQKAYKAAGLTNKGLPRQDK